MRCATRMMRPGACSGTRTAVSGCTGARYTELGTDMVDPSDICIRTGLYTIPAWLRGLSSDVCPFAACLPAFSTVGLCLTAAHFTIVCFLHGHALRPAWYDASRAVPTSFARSGATQRQAWSVSFLFSICGCVRTLQSPCEMEHCDTDHNSAM